MNNRRRKSGKHPKHEKAMPSGDLPRIFTKPNTISKHLRCVVCLEIFREPWHLSCGHTFCRNCIDQWRKTRVTCPECRENINPVFMEGDLLAQSILNDCEVACPKQHCPWTGELQHLMWHFTEECHFKADKKMKVGQTAAEEDDDELTQKINENMPKGSLLGRVLSRTDIYKKLQENEPKESSRKDPVQDFLDELF